MSATTDHAPGRSGDVTSAGTPVVQIRGLVKDFPVGGLFSRATFRALGGVDLDVRRGEILALVGESGSGKSTIARCVARLEQPTSGTLRVDGVDVLRTEPRRASRAYRAKVQMVFQDPFGSLNPAHRVEHFLTRALRLHRRTASAVALRSRLAELMDTVDLDRALLDAYPHELSGGQRQRVAIARALAVEPEVILADEPTSMLDVSVRIGILNLMRRLRDERGISLLYITHDLAAARYVADRTTVMFAGEVVEAGESTALMADPAHPYTQLLLSAVPDPQRAGTFDPAERAALRAQVLGATTCPYAADGRCRDDSPVHHAVAPGWTVRCHLYRPQTEVARRALDVAGTSNA
ncbi:ATP-binding cassette domain-containing protein [Antribacter sp. KLBMP9083]|uniref:ATP-binding cassette domain-containing protein n=1 Tax=Antribacter soli TaxID=2910976 RepID=A0AA41QCS0_9MICO|nr:ATP-binding cassette domain-containing protein [Antribacter soli]MCF4121060.1 ATP-binding cassette domain-containing protein [Antribacter soli]